MDCFCYYTTLQLGVWNAWIPTVGLVLIQYVFMGLFRETGKRATDTSWYTARERRHARWSFVWMFALLGVSLFVPLRLGTSFFLVGGILFLVSLVGFLSAFLAYWQTPLDETVRRGVYRISRNPMYFFYTLGMLGVCVASTSVWLLIPTVLLAYETHHVILGEERYCDERYGDTYREYKARTPRYFLFF